MNILFILPEYYPHSGGGISTYYEHYIPALKSSCNKLKVIVGSGYVQGEDTYNVDGIEVEYLKPSLYSKYLPAFSRFDLLPEFRNNLAAAWAMYEQGEYGAGFDIIECTDFALGFIPWVIERKKPVITRLHGSSGQITFKENDLQNTLQNDFVRQTELLLLPQCNILISHSLANKQWWASLIAKEVAYIPPVYIASTSQPIPFSERDDHGVVTARIQVWKGPVQLCEAVSVLENVIKPIRWYGRDTSYHEQKSMVSYLEHTFPDVWNKMILPQKAVSNAEAKELQKKALFGLVSSTWDMFNFTCLEFMAAGTPVICSTGAGVSELISDGVNGFTYEGGNVNALAQCLKKVSGLGKEEYEEIAMSGLSTIRVELSAEKLIPQNLVQYEKAVAGFETTIANDFIRHMYSPSDHHTDISSTLDGQTVKNLAKYLVKRIRSKRSKR